MKIGVVGGGILGAASAYYLSRAGHEVTVFEQAGKLGGLSDSFQLENGKSLEIYHHFFSASDNHLHELLSELNLSDKLQWNDTKLGSYRKGKIYNFAGVFKMLQYDCMNLFDRFRFLLSMFFMSKTKDWKKLDK
jgi:protoporphyrinogen oxidase